MSENNSINPTVRIADVTPWDQGPVAICGPQIFGASANRPFHFTIPATGERPVKFSAKGLPKGLLLDPGNGRISGTVQSDGDFEVLLSAENQQGRTERQFTIAIGRGLALTPPMGWNSWNAWRHWVDHDKIRGAAHDLVRTGLAARGYSYVNIDSCWQGKRGGALGAIQPNRKFPNMGSLAEDVHALGLKLGIYSTPWTIPWGCTKEEARENWDGDQLIGCSSGAPDPDYTPNSIAEGRFVGINKHEAQDIEQWVQWGIDFLKYDWNPTDPKSLERMGRLVRQADRDIVMSICTDARLADAETIRKWTNMWRGLADTDDIWPNVLKNAFLTEDERNENWRPHVGPGSWNDLDMLALGPQFHSAVSSSPNKLSPDEQITSMTAWALYPSPLFLSCDLSTLTDFELRLFSNDEVIAVNQDPLGKPAVRLREERGQSLQATEPEQNARIWARSLADGSIAIGFFNIAETPATLSVALEDLGLTGPVSARNLWERRDIDPVRDQLSVQVPRHGAQLIVLKQ